MNLNSILIGSAEPKPLIDYYSKLFGAPQWNEGDFAGWRLGTGFLSVGPHDQVTGKNPQPGRVLWNIEAQDVQVEFERLKGLGAAIVQEPYHPGESPELWIATFSDPDGNYFQLMSPLEGM